jgi:hypothetical protein
MDQIFAQETLATEDKDLHGNYFRSNVEMGRNDRTSMS